MLALDGPIRLSVGTFVKRSALSPVVPERLESEPGMSGGHFTSEWEEPV